MSALSSNVVSTKTILDTDLYKLTMQQAVFQHFPNIQASYRFTNRGENDCLSRQSVEMFRSAVSNFTHLALTKAEHEWLRATCPFLTPRYLEYLSQYRYKPEQVRIRFIPASEDGLLGRAEIEVFGPWVETILWEVPLMACLSEVYSQVVVTDWNYDNQEDQAYSKAQALLDAGCVFSEFGTRRRRSYHTQDLVVKTLVRAATENPSKGRLLGTSNVHFAHKYGITPIGTVAHEWFMGVAALRDYEQPTIGALDLWETTYPDSNLVALTDTFSTKVFFKEFVTDPDRVRRWSGLRQDSGDPFAFAPLVCNTYRSLKMDPHEKQIIYSDGLDTKKAIALRKQCEELGLANVSFGIGTFFTNDFRTVSEGGKSPSLNMVIKLATVDDKPCVKLSDDLTKNTGDKSTVERVKRLFDLPL